MSHRQRHLIEDLKELVLRLPWWASFLCALVAYAVMHPIAMLRMPTPSGAMDTAATAVGQLLVGLATVGQYVLPIGFLLAAAASGFFYWKREDIRSALASDASGSLLRGISREDVALLLRSAFRRQGFQIRETEGRAREAGFDLELKRDGARRVLQYRHWKSSRIDAKLVHELRGAMEKTGAAEAIVVISGHFSREAVAVAESGNITLLDGRRFKELVLAEQVDHRTTLEDPRMRQIIDGLRGLVRTVQDWAKARVPHPAGTPVALGQPRFIAAPQSPGSFTPVGKGDQQDAEIALGNALSDLIRAESATGLAGQPPPAQPRENQPGAPGPVKRPGSPIRIRKIVDLVGIVMTLLLIWASYDWFVRLPQTPPRAPWELLGRGQGEHTQLTIKRFPDQPGKDPDADVTLAALGQFDFGPSITQTPTEDPVTREAPVEAYRSIHELEAAFNARYVPPPDCFDWGSDTRMATCGNHRIRARRVFMESNGRTMVSEPPQEEQAPRPVAQTLERDTWDDGSWQTFDWGPPDESRMEQDWQSEPEWDPHLRWQSQRPRPTPPRFQTPREWQSPDDWQAEQDWQAPRVRQPRLEPLAPEDPRFVEDRRFREDWPPLVRRQPTEAWQGARSWRAEQEQREQDLRSQGEWESARDPAGMPDWGREQATNPPADWDADWLQRR